MGERVIFILGGYGISGKLIARLLLEQTDTRLVLAGRSLEKAQEEAASFNRTFEGERVAGAYADASDGSSLRQAFKGAELVVVASSTSHYAGEVACAALDSGCDYLDIQYSTKKVETLKAMRGEIERAGRCFITDGGFHPGLPAALVRYAATRFERLERAVVGSVIKIDWKGLAVSDSTVDELMEEMTDFQMVTFKDRQWKKAKLTSMEDFLRMDFGGEFGKQSCAPMMLEEMRSLPETFPSLKETGFFVGGFNWLVDWLVMPAALIALKLWPQKALKPMGKLMLWGLRAFSKPPYGTLLRVEASGEEGGKLKTMSVTIHHEDGYVFTAIPVAACLLQYLDGSIRKAGLWTQANIVEPERLMLDMERMGIDVQTGG